MPVARLRDEKDAFNGFADAQFLRYQNDSRTAAPPKILTEVVRHGANVVAYKNSSVFGRDSQDNVIMEALKWNLLCAPEIQMSAATKYA
jgi:hypothetical protein